MRTSGGNIHTLAIPVVNFPELQEGSAIEVYFGETRLIDSATIESYSASNKYGVEVLIELSEAFYEDAHWGELATLCKPDPTGHYTFVYPGVIDYAPRSPSLGVGPH